jgi:hypothetical protein
MLFVFVSVTLFIFLLAGAGRLFGGVCGVSPSDNPWTYVWLGYFASSTIAAFASFFVPLGAASLTVFLVAGGIGFPLWFRECRKSAHWGEMEGKIFFFIAFLCLFYLTIRLGYRDWTGRAYDTDLYHANVVRWFNEYGIVPGLGNLHMRLASNSSLFSIAAVFDNGPWNDRSEWIMPGIMIVGGMLYFLHEACFSYRSDFRLFAMVAFAWLALVAKSVHQGLYYDDPAHIINAAAAFEVYRMLKTRQGDVVKQLAVVMMLCAASFTIKPITSVSLIFCAAVSVYMLVKNRAKSLGQWLRVFFPPFCAGCVWLARNVVLAGYPFFPLPIMALPFDWTMTLEHAKFNYDTIAGWARLPGEYHLDAARNGFFYWFGQWAANTLREKDAWFLGIFPFATSIFLWIRVFWKSRTRTNVLFFLWSFLSIAYWFVSAPDARFGGGLLWLSLAASVACASAGSFDPARLFRNKKAAVAALCTLSIFVFGNAVLKFRTGAYDLFFVGGMPSYPVEEFITDTNPPFAIWVPKGEELRCGNSQIPSSPDYPRGTIKNIEMRSPGNIASGYRPQSR